MAARESNVVLKSTSGTNSKKAHRDSWGNLEEGTIYQDLLGARAGLEGYDLRPAFAKEFEPVYRAIDEEMAKGTTFRGAMEEVSKALQTTDLTLPVFPREELVNVATKRTPVWELLPKQVAETNTVDQDSVTDLADAEIGGELDVPDDGEDTFEAQSLSMTYWRVKGSVSGPMQLATAALRNEMSGEQNRKAMSMRQFAEDLALNGDPTTDDTDGGITDERAFKGIRTHLSDNSRYANPAGGEGSTIAIEDVRDTHRRAAEDGGSLASLLSVTDLKTLTDLKNALDEHDPLTIEGAGDGRELSFGGRGIRVDGIPVVVSDFMPNTDYDGGSPSTTGREFITIDLRYHFVHSLSDMVMEPLGKTRDSDDFFLKQYSVVEQSKGADKYTAGIENLA